MARARKQILAKNTTLAIDPYTNNLLSTYCEKNRLNKKLFIQLALKYFLKNDINIGFCDKNDIVKEGKNHYIIDNKSKSKIESGQSSDSSHAKILNRLRPIITMANDNLNKLTDLLKEEDADMDYDDLKYYYIVSNKWTDKTQRDIILQTNHFKAIEQYAKKHNVKVSDVDEFCVLNQTTLLDRLRLNAKAVHNNIKEIFASANMAKFSITFAFKEFNNITINVVANDKRTAIAVALHNLYMQGIFYEVPIVEEIVFHTQSDAAFSLDFNKEWVAKYIDDLICSEIGMSYFKLEII